MKNPSITIKKRSISYNDVWLRLLSALISAHLINVYGEKESVWELVKLGDYYRALAASFVIAIILVEFVYRITLLLDSKLPWEKKFYQRIIFQVSCGILAPLALDCLLAGIYYALHGTDLFKVGHFKYNFIVIALMITLLNAYYLIHYLIKFKIRRKPTHLSGIIFQDDCMLKKSYPLLIHSENKMCFEIDNNGSRNYLDGSLEQIFKMLPENDYFLINRGYIINRSVIEKMSPGKSRTIRLELRYGIHEDVYVSQRNSTAFKAWIANTAK
ncbi:MAG: hypothetical protein EOO43_22730 [Flavobacterium sp.]|nr:MAG: hypothetical protein EOO43_22730 [Flavobacterium sp.]